MPNDYAAHMLYSLHMYHHKGKHHYQKRTSKQQGESPIEYDDLISKFKRLFLVMRDQDAGHANLVYDGFEPLPYRRTYLQAHKRCP